MAGWGRNTKCNYSQSQQIYPTIKYTAEYLEKYIQFSDVPIYIENGVLKDNLFLKLTDTNQYLKACFCRPYQN